ncbi:sensor histidine kinase [Streptomyces echinatus]|uniref:histidine kinase n=1 Tax=Streptomyces echinatus TaxID=67293 RepID=A0A7W9Q090_9ACTN|nr:histidine kinase [Streptomyces echinatus]MBB5930954.1 signal transduction histidine kinase [Streptomyces echinatus]
METIRTWLLPLLLAAGQGILLWPGTGPDDAPTGPALVGALCALALETAALGWRRTAPLRALACTLVAVIFGGLAAPDGYLGIGPLIALYSVAVRCPVPVTVRATAAVVGVEWVAAAVQEGPRAALLSDMAVSLGAYLLCAGLGEARRRLLAGRMSSVRRLAGALDARRLAGDHERRRLARELHDVSAHHLTSVVVTVDAARRLQDDRPELAAEALSFAERTGAETLTALQRLVGLLRDADRPDHRPMSGRIEELVAGFGRLGPPVTARIPDDLAGPAAEAVHGIIREALTNALRYAPGAAARVRVRRAPGGLELTVENAPPRTAPQGAAGLGAGRGVSGMRERAASAGGELTAGPTPEGGWRVHATLPDGDLPRRQDEDGWRRDVLREQRFTDPALTLAAMMLPVSCVLALTEDWTAAARRAALPSLLVVCGLLVLHAVPLLWRRRAPWAVFLAVLATAGLGPVAVVAARLPSQVTEFLVAGTLVEVLAVYAVAAYGQGAPRTWPAPAAAALGTACVVTASACADGVVAGEPTGPADVVLLPFFLSVLVAPVFFAVWGAGVFVRRRRMRVLAFDDFAFASSIWQAERAAQAERQRLAGALREAVLAHTGALVGAARRGDLEQVAGTARAALAAMREMLHSLGGSGDGGSGRPLAPSPSAADLDALCHALRSAGRDVRMRGLPEAARELPPSVQVSVYRIVEAALGAGDAGPARVTLRRRRGLLRITVTGVRLAVAGPVAERLRVQVDAADGRIVCEPAGTLRVSLPAGVVPAPAQEVSPSPYA